MKHVSTPMNPEREKNGKQVSAPKVVLRPSERAISFLKMFARTYHVEPSLPEGLRGLVLN